MTLSFLGFEILKYWDILIEYINPLTILLWSIVGGLIGILLGILLLIIFRKKVLVKRYHWTLKCLSYAYLLILPLLAGFSFAQWAALHNCEQQIVRNIPKYLGDTQALYDTYLKAEVEKIVSEEILRLSGNELLKNTVESAQSIVGNTIMDESEDTQSASYKDKVSTYLVQTFLESSYVKDLIVTEARNQIGKALLMDEKLTKDIFDTEIQTLLDNGIIQTVLEKQIKRLTGGYKMNALLMLFVGLLIICVEIVLSNRFHHKKKQQLTPPPMPVTPPIPQKRQ